MYFVLSEQGLTDSHEMNQEILRIEIDLKNYVLQNAWKVNPALKSKIAGQLNSMEEKNLET